MRENLQKLTALLLLGLLLPVLIALAIAAIVITPFTSRSAVRLFERASDAVLDIIIRISGLQQ